MSGARVRDRPVELRYVQRAVSRPAIALRIAALLAAVMVSVSARPAIAQTNPIVMIWKAPAECPTPAEVEAEVESNLARSSSALAPVVAMVSVSGPTEGRWQASLLFQVGYTRAERRFEAESCRAIASAAALVIALWAEGRPDVPPPPAATARDAENPARRPGVELAGARYVLMLNGILDWGTMPDSPGGGMEAAGGPMWTFASWRLRALAGLSFFPNRRTQLMDSIEQATLQLFDLSGRACATVGSDRFEIGPCAGGELAVMRGSSADLQDRTKLWLSLLGSAMAWWNISPAVAVFGRAEVVLPTARSTFLTPYGNVVFDVPAAAVRGALGLELRF
jgi:hypothetical protein